MNGFRFELVTQPNAGSHGTDFFPTANIEPGSYLVTYDGTFHIEPLTPPQILITPMEQPTTALEVSRVSFAVANQGLQDVHDVQLEVRAISPAGTKHTGCNQYAAISSPVYQSRRPSHGQRRTRANGILHRRSWRLMARRWRTRNTLYLSRRRRQYYHSDYCWGVARRHHCHWRLLC